jgi:hypothetical protein
MPTLAEFYTQLLTDEELPAAELITQWELGAVNAIRASFRNAFGAAGMAGLHVPIRPESLPQSIGNQAATFFAITINPHLANYQIDQCIGHGYPDRVLTSNIGGERYPLELKTTSIWDAHDSHRRVLTCSSEKLRRHFQAPIHYILATMICRRDGNDYFSESVRLDFLNPDTLVSVRIEASVTHRMLTVSNHPHELIP